MPPKRAKFSTWTRLTRRKAQPQGGYTYAFGGGPSWVDSFRQRRAPTLPELAEAYKSIIFTCVRINATAVARVPLRLYAITDAAQARPKCATRAVPVAARMRLKTLPHVAKMVAGADEVDEVTGEHPLLEVLQHPNDEFDHAALLTYTVMSLDVVGSAYWWPTEVRLGSPRELWALPPHLVYPVFDTGYMVPSSYWFGAVQYAKDDLVRFKHLSAKNPYGLGMSPTQAAIEYARLEDTFVSIQDNLLSNGPRPALIVSHKDPKGTFGPAERKRLEHDMETRGRGGRAGGVFVVDGAAAVTPVSWAPADLGAVQISSYDLERTANCFDVPVSLLKTEDVNRANAEAGLEQHARYAVEPRCKLIASALTRWIHRLDRTGNLGWRRLFFAFDGVLREDKQAESALHKTYVDLGVLTRNEVRLDLGYEPSSGGDALLVATSLAPLEAIVGDSAAQDAEPSPEDERDPDADRDTEEPQDDDRDAADPDDVDDKSLLALAVKVLSRLERESPL